MPRVQLNALDFTPRIRPNVLFYVTKMTIHTHTYPYIYLTLMIHPILCFFKSPYVYMPLFLNSFK